MLRSIRPYDAASRSRRLAPVALGYGGNMLSFFSSSKAAAIAVKPTSIHDIERDKSKSGRTLKHLIKLNHAEHAILFNKRRFHNHLPHIEGSAYILGASSQQLEDIYRSEDSYLAPWRDSPGEISEHDWRDYLGNRNYERAWIDFFEDQLVNEGYDWQKLVNKFLYQGPNPLFHGLFCGQLTEPARPVAHPMIHLAYGYELQSRDVAIEALGLAATNYNFLHRYLDDPAYTRPPPQGQTADPFAILERIRNDARLADAPTGGDLAALFAGHEAPLLEHWNALTFSDPTEAFRASQHAAAAIFGATQPAAGGKYDFFLVHALTSSHATRVALPFVPPAHHVAAVRAWWLFAVAVYAAEERRALDVEGVRAYELRGRDWKWASARALDAEWRLDAHFVKPIRALKEAAETWGDEDEFFLKTAVKFIDTFDGSWLFGAAHAGGTEEESTHG